MKNFIIINGKKAKLIKANDIDEAKEKAENICDHSLEIIIREISVINGIELIEDFEKYLKLDNNWATYLRGAMDYKEGKVRPYKLSEYK